MGVAFFVRDRRTLNGNLGFNRATWSLSATAIDERTNPTGEPGLDQAWNQSPSLDARVGLTQTFFWRVGLRQAHQEAELISNPLIPFSNSKRTGLTTGFDVMLPPASSLAFNAQFDRLRSEGASDTTGSSTTFSLGGSLALGQRVRVPPNLSWSRTLSDPGDQKTTMENAFLNADVALIPGILGFLLNGGISRTERLVLMSGPMRNLLITLTLLCALSLRAQGTIAVTPGVPVVGAPTTFVLSPTYPPIGPVSWDFGDQTQPLSGGIVASHVYARTGSYTVRASYPYAAGQGLPLTVQLPILVATRLGPSAPFTISMLRLRWEDGRVDRSVEQGFSPLVVFADLKFEGTGILQAQWVVDGIPLGTFATQLAFAGTVTLDSRSMLPLPTTAPGEHWATLRILSPQVVVESPQIRYFVKVDSEEAPQIDEVIPTRVRPGEETELRIRGRRLAPGVVVSFGKDSALVAPLRFPEPGWAIAKVFVAPTTHPGFRETQAASKAGRSRGPARLEVLPRPHRAAATDAGLAPPTPLVAFLWSEGDGVARPSLVRALTAAFFPPEDSFTVDTPGLFQVASGGY